MAKGKLSKKREREERNKLIREDPAFWEKFFASISEGVSMMETVALMGVAYTTVWRWIDNDPELSDRMKHARRLRADRNAARIEQMARELEAGGMDPNAARVAIDARKWIAARMDPHIWGDKIHAEVQVTDATKLHLEALKQRMQPKVINPTEDDSGD